MYYRHFRIFFTILSAICLAALFPVGTFFDWGWAGMCGLLALLFFGIMLLFKQSQQNYEKRNGISDDLSEKTEKTTETETTNESSETSIAETQTDTEQNANISLPADKKSSKKTENGK